MNFDITPSRACLGVGGLLFAAGYYLGVTSADNTNLCIILLVFGLGLMIASMVLQVKAAGEKEQRRMKSFMRAVDNMPLAETAEEKQEANGEEALETEEEIIQKPVAKPVVEKPVAKPVAEKPVAKPVAEKPVAKAVAEKPVAKPVVEKPVAKTARPSLSSKMESSEEPLPPKKINISNLPTFDPEEDWGVYEETNVSTKKK